MMAVALAEAVHLEGRARDEAAVLYHVYQTNGWRYIEPARHLLRCGYTPFGVRYMSDNLWERRQGATNA